MDEFKDYDWKNLLLDKKLFDGRNIIPGNIIQLEINQDTKLDCIIVGAGIVGLTTAYTYKEFSQTIRC